MLPVFLFDPRQFGTTSRGCPKTGGHRARFLRESVISLRSSLRSIGSDLLVGVGKPEEVLPSLKGSGAMVLCQAQVTSEELGVDEAIKRAIAPSSLLPLWGGTLYEKEELPFAADLSDLPDVFTPFRNKVEKGAIVQPPLPSPAAGSLPLPAGFTPPPGLDFETIPSLASLGVEEIPEDPRGVMHFAGGETAALARLRHYLWDTRALSTYFETRNGMLGADYSSKLAPYLALGCISPRAIAAECRRYEAEVEANKSTYWLVFELIWRDYFRYYCAKHGDAVFKRGGPIRSNVKWRVDPALLQRWKEGRLGVPLVDANMRELAATGFMSNRGRQNVASYLALDLQLDWRQGAAHFESLLLDYDVCSNWGVRRPPASFISTPVTCLPIPHPMAHPVTPSSRIPPTHPLPSLPLDVLSLRAPPLLVHCIYSCCPSLSSSSLQHSLCISCSSAHPLTPTLFQNWVAAAGLTGGRVNRFNIVKQSKDYDPDGDYVRHWLPELKQLPAQFVHEPWKMSVADQQRYGVKIGAYGAPDTDYPTPPKSHFEYGKGGAGGGGGRGPTQAPGGKAPGRARGKGNGRGKRLQHDYTNGM